jgi:hypothetical protein
MIKGLLPLLKTSASGRIINIGCGTAFVGTPARRTTPPQRAECSG